MAEICRIIWWNEIDPIKRHLLDKLAISIELAHFLIDLTISTIDYNYKLGFLLQSIVYSQSNNSRLYSVSFYFYFPRVIHSINHQHLFSIVMVILNGFGLSKCHFHDVSTHFWLFYVYFYSFDSKHLYFFCFSF